MKLPEIWRKRRKDKKEYGNCRATVGGEDINLGTADKHEAREVLRSILIQKAAESSEPDVEDGAADTNGVAAIESPGQSPTPSVAPSPAPAAPVAAASSPPASPAPANDNADARAEAEATNAAAADVAAAAAAAAAPDPTVELLEHLPPDAIEGMLLQGGQAIVLGQLMLQGWIIKKRFGRIVQPLEGPLAQKTIDAASRAWVAQLNVWFPDIKSCPPWLIAVVAPVLLLPEQLRTSLPDPHAKPAENQAGQPAQAAA